MVSALNFTAAVDCGSLRKREQRAGGRSIRRRSGFPLRHFTAAEGASGRRDATWPAKSDCGSSAAFPAYKRNRGGPSRKTSPRFWGPAPVSCAQNIPGFEFRTAHSPQTSVLTGRRSGAHRNESAHDLRTDGADP